MRTVIEYVKTFEPWLLDPASGCSFLEPATALLNFQGQAWEVAVKIGRTGSIPIPLELVPPPADMAALGLPDLVRLPDSVWREVFPG